MHHSLIKQNTGFGEEINIGYVTYKSEENYIKIYILEDLSKINSFVRLKFNINIFMLVYLVKLRTRFKNKKPLLSMISDILLIGSSVYYRAETLIVAKAGNFSSRLSNEEMNNHILQNFKLVSLFQEPVFKEIKININDLDKEIKIYGGKMKGQTE